MCKVCDAKVVPPTKKSWMKNGWLVMLALIIECCVVILVIAVLLQVANAWFPSTLSHKVEHVHEH